ncbi:hypothetical protein PP178_02870 [Zeaxanthinibacter sp. PT1]|uniref:hypothetical protein n=1 Tax=Zeaxanthinibacter TaxID=561554 RepID=UPI0023495B1E|nr:hypothetical protein [Zeaxanthinibacter sp. PT1]MDC6350479.1 hypothetical protein [Zeaxanthinibacter sp. PT1]
MLNKNNIQPTNWKLSKSTFLKGNQCVKALYLNKHHWNEGTPPTAEQQELFNRGRKFEAKFRSEFFGQQVDITKVLGKNFKYYKGYTEEYLIKHDKGILFEATFIEDEVMVMVDVLKKNQNNSYDIFEVKLHTELTQVVWEDLAIQNYVLQKALGDKINSFHIVYRSSEGEYIIREVREELKNLELNISELLENYKSILQQKEIPDKEMGAQCESPYPCNFREFCSQF